ncbi:MULTISPECIES: PTS sugar transporter subunit IIA [Listeria]|uniref:PTS sugar transporter subunit IIA n=1 Tax=Listeria TaxID=1637 RepID=UPI000B5981C0|nr:MULTISPECIES: PTS sugar transporter subunit IIA [Listeria]
MNRIILVSHGKLALGMKDTLDMIIGEKNEVIAFAAYSDDEPFEEKIREKVHAEYQQKSIIIVTDILGGSVNNEMLKLMQTFPNIHLLAGMNLPLIIELATYPNAFSKLEMAEVVAASKAAIVDCQALLKATRKGGEGFD